MATLSDATLLAISRISVGTPVTDGTDFTAMTPAQVAAKFALSSYGGDAGSYVYAPGADGDYDALDPDDPPVTDLGLWPVGAFVNVCPNGLMAGAVAGSPGTTPTRWTSLGTYQQSLSVATSKGLPAITIVNNGAGVDYLYCSGNIALTAAQKYSYGCIAGATVASGLLVYNAGTFDDTSAEFTTLGLQLLQNQTRGADGNSLFGWSRGQAAELTLAGPQAVIGLAICPPVLALSGAATTTKLAAITQREVSVWKPFVVVIEATTGEDPGAHQVLYSLSRSANELIEIYRATSTHQITLKIRSGGVDHTKTLGSVADNTAFSVAINVFARSSAASLNGGTTQVLVAPKPSGVLTLESIGCKHDGTLQCGGPIAECNLIHPAVYTAEQLEAA